MVQRGGGLPDIFTAGPIAYESAAGLYHIFVVLAPSAARVGVTAPPVVSCGGVAGGLQFDTTARRAYFPMSILNCWDGTRDLWARVPFAAETADPFSEGETFEWSFDYRAPDLSAGEGWETGTLKTLTATYTQPALGAGVACAGGFVDFTFPRGDADQGYDIGHSVSGALRKSGGTYSGGPTVGSFLWFLPVVAECLQG